MAQAQSGPTSNPGSLLPPPLKMEPSEGKDTLGNQYIDESGEVRYYGKSSGYYMLRNSKNFQGGAFRFDSRGYRIDGDDDQPLGQPVLVDPYALPPEDLSNHLIDLYFSHFYPFLPILHKKSFLASLQSERRPPHLLLNAIYALASRVSADLRVRTDPSLPSTAGDVFFERAKLLLNNEWDHFRVETVQSLILMSSHQNGAMKTIRGWLYSGLVSLFFMHFCYSPLGRGGC